ncbi:hypothetical protein TeGR_g7780, partial [Tetraparma gracilis]
CPEPGDADHVSWVAHQIAEDPDWESLHADNLADQECIWNEAGCVCKTIGEVCYSDHGVAYDLFLAVMGISFAYLTVQSFIWTRAAILAFAKADSKKKQKGYSPMDKIMFMSTAACLLRFIWVIAIFNGRRGEDVIGGLAADTVLVKVPQILWMGSYVYLVLVWRKLLSQV